MYYNTVIYHVAHNTAILGIKYSSTNPTTNVTFLSNVPSFPSKPQPSPSKEQTDLFVAKQKQIELSKLD